MDTFYPSEDLHPLFLDPEPVIERVLHTAF